MPANQPQSKSSSGVASGCKTTPPVAASTATAVSNTVLASVTGLVGLDTAGDIGTSGIAGGSGGGPTSASASEMPTATNTTMEKSDPVAGPNTTDPTAAAAQTSSPKLLRPAVFDKVYNAFCIVISLSFLKFMIITVEQKIYILSYSWNSLLETCKMMNMEYLCEA